MSLWQVRKGMSSVFQAVAMTPSTVLTLPITRDNEAVTALMRQGLLSELTLSVAQRHPLATS